MAIVAPYDIYVKGVKLTDWESAKTDHEINEVEITFNDGSIDWHSVEDVKFVMDKRFNADPIDEMIRGLDKPEDNGIGVNVPDRNGRPLDLIWPHNQREADIIKQQNDLHDYFHWQHAIIGFIFGTMFWSACFHLWGG